MSEHQSWYQQKLQQMRSAAPPAPSRQFPRTQTVQPQQFQMPGRVQAPPQQQQAPPPPQDYDSQAKQGEAKLSDLLALQSATGVAKPGQGARLNPHHCPSCGSNNFFSNLGVTKRGPAPAPRCFDCGYNDGLFTQGEQSSWMV